MWLWMDFEMHSAHKDIIVKLVTPRPYFKLYFVFFPPKSEV